MRKFTRPERVPFGSHRMMTKDHHLVRFFFLVVVDASVFNSNKVKKIPRIFDTDDGERLDDFARMAAVLS